MSAAQSTIYVCSGVKLNSRYEHTIYFADRAAQLDYFAGKVVKTFSNYTFLRKSWNIKVSATMGEASSWSYLYFRNGAGSKYYFYFIENIEYINDGTVELSLTLDVMQTYLFDYELLTSFVEREHSTSDQIGEHTLDEGLELGELTTNEVTRVWDLTDDFCILVLSSITLNGVSEETTINAYSSRYDNVFSGLKLYAVDMVNWVKWGQQLDNLSAWGQIDGIVNMWMYPKALVLLGGEATWGSVETADKAAKPVGLVQELIFDEVPSFSSFGGYTEIKNNKMYTYPYNLLYVTNNNGMDAVYRYENFADTPSFRIQGALSPDAGARISPYKYNGTENGATYADRVNNHEGITLPPYPSCAWDSDTYKMWLAQNQGSHTLQAATGVISIVGGAAAAVGGAIAGAGVGAMAGLGMIGSGVAQITNLLAAKHDMSIQPPQAKGSYSSNIAMIYENATFTFFNKSVKAERAKSIDDYFTMYGYKVNRCKIPNTHARTAFTYTKTVGCHIKANLCNADATKIESIFDNGITFWRDGDQIGNYAQDNSTL